METYSSITFLRSVSCSYPTYEEWKLGRCLPMKKRHFGSYPTYEEWKQFKISPNTSSLYSSYPTYEEWKHFSKKDEMNRYRLFLSYLWGMETCMPLIINSIGSVLILPMRNGNQVHMYLCHYSLPCSYPTYEEWKHAFFERRSKSKQGSYPTYEEWKHVGVTYRYTEIYWFLSYLWGMETWRYISIEIIVRRFLSYLWGMETRKSKIYKQWNICVLILPMRNGNFLCNTLIQLSPAPVLILPMRNGNHFQQSPIDPSFLVLILPMRNGNIDAFHDTWHVPFVLILPMRNGNILQLTKYTFQWFRSYPTYEEWKRLTIEEIKQAQGVLILPMRNGNNGAFFIDIVEKPFLSYLWGMETRLFPIFSVYITYRVLILPMRNGNSNRAKTICFIVCVLILPMRNGNP